MNKKISFFTVLIFTCVVYSQGPPPPPPPPGLSLSGGLLFLIASGVLYGVKKLKK